MDPISRHAQAAPEALALWTASMEWTYGEFNAVIAKKERNLGDKGIGDGARVALRLPNEAPMIALLWALWRRGAVAVPLSTRLPPEEAVRQAQRVDCEMLLTDDSEVRAVAGSAGFRVLAPGTFTQTGGGPTEPSRDLSDDQPATILFTSGSTGTPKAALHAWGNHRYSAKGANANLPLRRGDRWLLSLPLYHVGGLAILVRCALAGAAVAIPPDTSPLHDALRTAQATHVSFVATQLRRLLDATTGAPPSTLRAVLLGGGPIPDAVLQRGHERGWPLLTSYGCTEMASQVVTTAPGAPFGDLSTAGGRLPHRRLRIVDGEIQVAGAPLFRGYVTDEGLDDARTDDDWYRTGDRGRLDACGRLHVLGRIDRMFVSGGENIQPEEIETILERLDGVERAVVVPVPDAEYGQRPVAFVRLGDGVSRPDFENELRRFLPGFKIPDAFHSLPRSAEATGLKIDRSALRDRARELL
jgi:O-succinylbenzoic acid--CoA ligase